MSSSSERRISAIRIRSRRWKPRFFRRADGPNGAGITILLQRFQPTAYQRTPVHRLRYDARQCPATVRTLRWEVVRYLDGVVAVVARTAVGPLVHRCGGIGVRVHCRVAESERPSRGIVSTTEHPRRRVSLSVSRVPETKVSLGVSLPRFRLRYTLRRCRPASSRPPTRVETVPARLPLVS